MLKSYVRVYPDAWQRYKDSYYTFNIFNKMDIGFLTFIGIASNYANKC